MAAKLPLCGLADPVTQQVKLGADAHGVFDGEHISTALGKRAIYHTISLASSAAQHAR